MAKYYRGLEIESDCPNNKSMDPEAYATIGFLKSAYADEKFAPISQIVKCVPATRGAIERMAKKGEFEYRFETLWGEETMFVEWRKVLDTFGEVPVQDRVSAVKPHAIDEYDYTEMLSPEAREGLARFKARAGS